MSAAVETPAPAAPAPSAPAPAAPTPAPAASSTPDKPAKTGIDALPGRSDDWDPKAFAEKHRAKRDTEQKARAPKTEKDAPTTSAAPPKAEPAQAVAGDAAAPATATPGADAPAVRTLKVKLRGEEKDVPLDKVARMLQLPLAAVETIIREHGEAPIVHNFQKQWNGDDAARSLEHEKRQRADLERKVRSVFGKATSSPQELARMIFKHSGVNADVKEIALQIAQEELELDALPQSERELRTLKAELAMERAEREAMLAEHERVMSEAREREEKAARQTFIQEFDEEMSGALTDAKLPADGYTRDRLLTLLAREQQQMGERYRPPVGRAEMRARAARFVAQIESELDAIVASRAEVLGPEGFAAKHGELSTAIGQRQAEERMAEFRKNHRAQVQGIRDRADTEERRPPPRQGEDLMAWVNRVFKD
jgi:hypothetical protein